MSKTNNKTPQTIFLVLQIRVKKILKSIKKLIQSQFCQTHFNIKITFQNHKPQTGNHPERGLSDLNLFNFAKRASSLRGMATKPTIDIGCERHENFTRALQKNTNSQSKNKIPIFIFILYFVGKTKTPIHMT